MESHTEDIDRPVGAEETERLEYEETEKPDDRESHPLHGDDPEEHAKQVTELAKARFRKWLKQGLESTAEKRKAKTRSRRRASTATTVNALADVAGLSIEEQLQMQIACLTQSVFECTTRAAAQLPPEDEDNEGGGRYGARTPPDDARRSYRSVELFSQSHLAHATARLVDTVHRIEGGEIVRHAFTYEHLHRHAATAAQTPAEKEAPEKPLDETADEITNTIFEDVVITRDPPDEDPSPSPIAA